MAGCWFSLGTPVSSTNKTDHHDITEILLKVALNTINQSIKSVVYIDNILSVIFTFSFELTERYCQYQQINSDSQNYLTLCRFSFEIKESGDKRMV